MIKGHIGVCRGSLDVLIRGNISPPDDRKDTIMDIKRLTERVWYYPHEEERDRPNLGYIRGDRYVIAVDAGHSAKHTSEFYAALEREGLPLPDITVLTHWHWDHTFGMHTVHGLTLANRLTYEHLRSFREEIDGRVEERFFSLHQSIAREYAGGEPVIITMPDMVFSGEMLLDAGNCPIRIYQTESPHTDDSTFIQVMDEKVLFVGDASGGTFPTWEKDPVLLAKLRDTIAAIDADIIMEGHWVPQTKEEMLQDLSE